jgi:hypothetical protein
MLKKKYEIIPPKQKLKERKIGPALSLCTWYRANFSKPDVGSKAKVSK